MKLTDDMLREAASEAAEHMDAGFKETDAHTFSPEFEQKMEEMMRQQNKKEKRRKHLRYCRNIAAAAVLVLLILPFANTDVRASYKAFFQAVEEWTDGSHSLFTRMIGTQEDITFQEAKIGWLPTGLQFKNREKEDNYLHLFYKSADGHSLNIEQQLVKVESGSVTWLGEDAEVSEIDLNGKKATLTIDEDIIMLVWQDGNYQMELSGNLSKEDMTRVAENISVGEDD